MSLHFFLPSGEALTAIPGLPDSYNGPRIVGTTASHIKSSFGSIVLQEYNSRSMSLCKVEIAWKKPEQLICRYDVPPVVLCRTGINNNVYELLKGAGSLFTKPREFTAVCGREWTGMLVSEKAAEHNFIHLSWSADFLKDFSMTGSAIPDLVIKGFYYGLPQKITPVAQRMSNIMMRNINYLLQMDYSLKESGYLFHEAMSTFLNQLVPEIVNNESLRKEMTKSEWYNVTQARQVIDENLDKRFTTPELSVMIGMNEFKLKKLFRKLTGFPIDEYRKYQVFMKAARDIIQNPDKPLKLVAVEAGYISLASFIRAFKSLCLCTPGELREESWDVSRIVPNRVEQGKAILP